jgi:hypothetical protein
MSPSVEESQSVLMFHELGSVYTTNGRAKNVHICRLATILGTLSHEAVGIVWDKHTSWVSKLHVWSVSSFCVSGPLAGRAGGGGGGVSIPDPHRLGRLMIFPCVVLTGIIIMSHVCPSRVCQHSCVAYPKLHRVSPPTVARWALRRLWIGMCGVIWRASDCFCPVSGGWRRNWWWRLEKLFAFFRFVLNEFLKHIFSWCFIKFLSRIYDDANKFLYSNTYFILYMYARHNRRQRRRPIRVTLSNETTVLRQHTHGQFSVLMFDRFHWKNVWKYF